MSAPAPHTRQAAEPGKTYIERVAARAGARIPPETVARVCRAMRDEPLDGVKYGRALNFHMTLANAIHQHAAAVAARAAAAVRHMGAGP